MQRGGDGGGGLRELSVVPKLLRVRCGMTRMKPYSEHIIFFDTEFTDLDVRQGELISIGMVKPSGEELYLECELEHPDRMHAWVRDHVVPQLEGNLIAREVARERIRAFLGPREPYLIAYVNQFDAVYWYRLFDATREGNPAFWIPLDFSSILFAHGFHPGSLGHHKFYDMLGIDRSKYREHHALDDARLLKEAYGRFLERIKNK